MAMFDVIAKSATIPTEHSGAAGDRYFSQLLSGTERGLK